MSKLIDMLERASSPSQTPMGFGPASRRADQRPALAVIGRVLSSELEQDPGLAQADVDAVLVELHVEAQEDAAHTAFDALDGKLWGLSVDERVGLEIVAAARERGCDFVALDTLGAPASLLSEDDLGKLVAVEGDLDERTAGAIRSLSFDGALYHPPESLSPLSLGRLIAVQRVHRLLGNPFLVGAFGELSKPDLKELRDAGIAGIVMELSGKDTIARTRESIRDLPRSRPRPRQRRNVAPLVPSVQPGQAEADDYDDEGRLRG